jgi:hypothetical protein
MTLRRLELLQWFGLLAAPLAWTVQLVAGFGVADAHCAPAGSRWGIDVETWEIALTAVAGTVAVSAEVSALTLYRELRNVEDDAPGPRGRLHFFSVAALIGNVLFIALITLTAVGVLTHLECRSA